ncbi:FAD linked oxidase [Macleaya cordata]|uniref:L-gulonolactone oxidase n=1 Tax=Macleaya cordata TaxID=56857 RepID=A0A200Q2N2_MACCD|nr:FAD linked oxidase [Macleaya cordata]
MVSCSPPENPIKCSSKNSNCTITNSLGAFPDRTVCKVANVFYPTTEQELISVVAMATMNKNKVKVATRYSHSIPKLVCPDGQDGLLISTLNLNHTLKIDVSTMTMTVESGVTLRDVIQQAAKAGLALPSSPYWWGLTVGGLISTGAHGSTLWGNGSYFHDYVEQIRIVTPAGPEEGYARVRTLDNNHPDIKAAKVSLGVLGVISQVTLKLQPLFKRSITFSRTNDSDLATQATTFGNAHEFADITWYPNQRKAIYRFDDRVSSNASGNGLNDFTGFRSTLSPVLALIRSLEENQESTNDANGKCISAKLTTLTLRISAFGYTNDGSFFTGYPIVGFQNRLQASGTCLDSPNDGQITACPWDPRVKGQFYHQTAINIVLSKVKNFIEDIQKLRDLEPTAFCGLELHNGILMRYIKASNAYLGRQEDSVDFDITYYRSKNASTPRLFEDILEEIEQLAVFKYGGIPHWGKNRNVAFVGAINKYVNAGEFLKVKQMYDPSGIFSSEWTDQVLGLKGGLTIVKKGCALEGLCKCSEDIHCAPEEGYVCRPGRIYKDARVCTHLSTIQNLAIQSM